MGIGGFVKWGIAKYGIWEWNYMIILHRMNLKISLKVRI
jgi:hypothetical protein